MKVISKSISLDSSDYYKRHLYIINPMLPIQLTDKEIDVLSTFMSFTGDLAKEPFSTTGRKIVMEKLSLSAGGLSNYIRQLKEKGFLVGNSYLQILPILVPESNVQIYSFKIVKNEC